MLLFLYLLLIILYDKCYRIYIRFINWFGLEEAPPFGSWTVIINNIEQQEPLIEIVQVRCFTTYSVVT